MAADQSQVWFSRFSGSADFLQRGVGHGASDLIVAPVRDAVDQLAQLFEPGLRGIGRGLGSLDRSG